MDFDFNATSQKLFEELAGKEEEKRQVSEVTVKKIAEDNAQALMNQRKQEFAAALSKEQSRFAGIGGSTNKESEYTSAVEEAKKEEEKDEEKKKNYYGSSSSSTASSRFGSVSSSSSSTTQSSEEKKAKAMDSYVIGLRDELNNIGKSISGNIKMDAALSELERKVENDAPWTIRELQESHEKFVSTGGGRYVTKATKESISKSKARDLKQLKKEFDRDKDILGFLVGGLKIWKD